MFQNFTTRLTWGWLAFCIAVIAWGYWIGHSDPHDSWPWLSSVIVWPIFLTILIRWVIAGGRAVPR